MNLHALSLRQMAEGLRSRQFSSRELTQHFLDRITRYDSQINSFITVDEAAALRQAEAADEALKVGKAGPLTGIPVAQKDIFCTRAMRSSCGSRMLENFVSPYDADVVERIHGAGGAVLLGKTNMDEFAMGSSNETSWFGPVRNPWDLARVPGGSSGGSAAAVAAGLAPVATGTDTGGSIRQPAALTNLTGIKPTYGRVSRFGMIAFASSLDQAGVLAHSAEDAAVLLQAMSGFDRRDSTSVDRSVEPYQAQINRSVVGLRIGLPREYFSDGLSPAVKDCVMAAAKELASQGATLVDIELPNAPLSVPTYYVVAPAEASSNLARYDGVRYGYRAANANSLEELYTRSRGEGFGAEVQRRIMVGTYVLSHGYYDAYYLKAQKVRKLIYDDFRKAFTQCDVILGPTTTEPAFALGAKTDDPVAMYYNDIYTIAANLAGLPALSLPCGFVKLGEDGGQKGARAVTSGETLHDKALPVGMQLIGNFFDEAKLLSVAHQYQQTRNWHQRMPGGFE